MILVQSTVLVQVFGIPPYITVTRSLGFVSRAETTQILVRALVKGSIQALVILGPILVVWDLVLIRALVLVKAPVAMGQGLGLDPSLEPQPT